MAVRRNAAGGRPGRSGDGPAFPRLRGPPDASGACDGPAIGAVMDLPDELIVAPATVSGPGVRAIVRVAGAGLDRALERLFTLPAALPAVPAAVAATFRPDRLGVEWGAVPVTILRWPGPSGPVGGPLAEIQLPASAALVDAVVAEICLGGARVARGGEFTLRAFLSGRIDLLQAESVVAVVDARTPAELSMALDRMAGGAGRELSGLRDAILDLAADVEAAIDFADEQGTGHEGADRFWGGLADRLDRLSAAADRIAATVEARDASARAGLARVVITGPPNVGKSSLFNALAGRGVALVADERGTTRDWLETPVRLARGGGEVEWILVDTAGIGSGGGTPGDDPGAAAEARAAEEVLRADVVVRCRDAGGPPAEAAAAVAPGTTVVDVLTRCDRVAGPIVGGTAIATSVRTGAGIGPLAERVAAAVAELPRRAAGERMRAGVAGCRAALVEAGAMAAAALAGAGGDETLVAAALVAAVGAIDDVTGAAMGNDLLDRIFSRHCIGK